MEDKFNPKSIPVFLKLFVFNVKVNADCNKILLDTI